MKKNWTELGALAVSALVSGAFIGLGATAFLAIKSAGGTYLFNLIGSLFFTLGLYAIIHWQLWLYTGKVGFVFEKPFSFTLKLIPCITFNLLGAALFALLIKATRLAPNIIPAATSLVSAKMADSYLSIFILACLCGVMIYVAVKGHAICAYGLAKTIVCFLSISIFILCGFEHVVANAVYFTYADVFSGRAAMLFVLMALGNGVGSIVTDAVLKIASRAK